MADQSLNFNFDGWLRRGGDERLRNFVLERSYGRLVWPYSCINLIAKSIAGLPVRFVKTNLDVNTGETEEQEIFDPRHPVNTLFNPPNPPEIPSLAELLKRTFIHLGLDGGCYWVFPELASGKPKAALDFKRLTELKPVLNDQTGDLIGWVRIGMHGGPLEAYTSDQVIAIWYYNPETPLSPMPPLKAARLSLEQEFYMNAFNASFFRQGLKNPLAIKTKKTLTPKQKNDLERMLHSYYSGVEGSHKAVILDVGMETADLGMTAKDIEFLNGKKLNREEICAVYGVPPALVGIFEYANYANTKEQRKIFWQGTLLSEINSLTDIVQTNIMEKYFPDIEFRFDLSKVDVLKPDPKATADTVKIYKDAGYSHAKIAEILEMPELASTTVEGEEEEEEPPPEETPPEEDDDEEEDEDTPAEQESFYFRNFDYESKQFKDFIIKQDEAWWLEYGRMFASLLEGEVAQTQKTIGRFLNQIKSTYYRRLDSKDNLSLSPQVWLSIWSDMLNPSVDKMARIAAEVTLKELEAADDTVRIRQALRQWNSKQIALEDYLNDHEREAFMSAVREVNNKVTAIGQDILDQLNSRTSELLRTSATVEELRKEVGNIVQETYSGRSLTIARTTTNTAYNKARFTLQQMKGARRIRWVNAGDINVRPDHMLEGGNVVDSGEAFPITRLLHPHDPAGPPEQVINCRCTDVVVELVSPGQPGSRPRVPTERDQLGNIQDFSFNKAMRGLSGTLFADDLSLPHGSVLTASQAEDIVSTGVKWARKNYSRPEWVAVSDTLDQIPDRPLRSVISSNPRGVSTKAKKEMARFAQRPLPKTVRDEIPPVRISSQPGSNRAGYDVRRKTILLPENSYRNLVDAFEDLAAGKPLLGSDSYLTRKNRLKALEEYAHEYGHHIQENNSKFASFAQDFITSRNEGLTVQDVVDVNRLGEKGLPDEFWNKYMGRVYPGEQFPIGTEVTSVFYERMALLPWDKRILQEYRRHLNSDLREEAIVGLTTGRPFLADKRGSRQFLQLLIGLQL